MKVPANCRRIGRWRIVEADLWDRAHLDLCGPTRLTITAQGGEIAFGALEAGLEVEYARDPLAFTRPAARKATSSMAKEPPNFSTTAPSRSSSSTQTATKPSSKRNGTLLQQPVLMFAVKGFDQASVFWFSPGAVLLNGVHGRGQSCNTRGPAG